MVRAAGRDGDLDEIDHGSIAAAEWGEPCGDVLTQLAGVTHALNRAGFLMVSGALENCIADPEGAQEREGIAVEELEKLFLALA